MVSKASLLNVSTPLNFEFHRSFASYYTVYQIIHFQISVSMANLTISAQGSAASSSMASSSATTSCTPWDIFINHRGANGEKAARYLYRRLNDHGLMRVFFDKVEMEKGQNISRQLTEAIGGASVYIAILSPRYAESWWCLDELALMVELMVESGKAIFPVFYKVQPSVVRYNVKDGAYADALRDLAKKTTPDPKTGEEKPRYSSDKIQKWRGALSTVADLSGCEIRDEDYESEELDNVVERVLKMVPKPLLSVAEYPTGLDFKVAEYENFEKRALSNQERCKVVGIVGVGGVGKTTLAMELFNRRRSVYTKSSFLFDVRQNPITLVQKNLLEAFIGEKDCKIQNPAKGLGILKRYLSSFNGFIVLDDIDDASQLNALLPIRDILGHESLILVTSRDKHVLRSSGVLESSIYYLKGLSESHSKELFCRYALNQQFPSPEFEDLVKRFVKSCDGLPLSLKVFGALVCGRNESYWQESLVELEKVLSGTEIHKSLKISYDKLSSDDQDIFLDIASFFIGEERDLAIRVLGLRGIENLQDKCLFEMDAKNCIRMHDHFRDLARNIAQESGSRRLWQQSTKDIDDLLEQSSRIMIEVRGITMFGCDADGKLWCTQGPKPRCKIPWDDSRFRGISNLQFVAADGDYLEPILDKTWSPNLRWLRWHNCPYSCVPEWIPMENLRVLEMRGQRFKSLWKEESRPPLQLRELRIQNNYGAASSFLNIPKSIGQLQYLENITISRASLKSLPEEFCELRSLKYLCLNDCTVMISLPDSFGRLINLQRITLKSLTSLRKLPQSFRNLTRLKSLDLSGCDRLILSSATLGNITTLEYLNIFDLNVTELPPQIEHQRSLKELDMTGANFKELPNWIGNLCNLEKLAIGSHSLEVLLPLSLSNLRSLKYLGISGSRRLKYLPNPFPPLSQLERLHIEKCGIEHLPQELLKMNNLLHLQVSSCPLLELPFKKIEEERERGRELNKLESFHDDVKCMLALKEIYLDDTEISEAFFPECVCPNLTHLSLTRCKKLTQIGGLCGLSKLQYLDISMCVTLEELPNLEMLISLEELDASKCRRLRSIPGLEQLKKLSHLNVGGCHEMLELSGAKHLMLLKRLYAYDCPKLRWGEGELEHLRQRLKEGLDLRGPWRAETLRE